MTGEPPLRVAVIGLGEAGGAIAADLAAAGAQVRGWDPAGPGAPVGVELAAGPVEAAAACEAVLSVNSAAAARGAAESVLPSLARDSLFADLNTAAPALKRELAGIVADAGAAFADVALMSAVPGRGLRTPALASGSGAGTFVELFGPLGMPVSAIGPEPGDAAARKLVRSVFAKGLAAAIGEALAAAERLGFERWSHDDIERTLEQADAALLRRLIEGSRVHAPRRADEMVAAVEMLEELGVPARISAASEAWLRSLPPNGAPPGSRAVGAGAAGPPRARTS